MVFQCFQGVRFTQHGKTKKGKRKRVASSNPRVTNSDLRVQNHELGDLKHELQD